MVVVSNNKEKQDLDGRLIPQSLLTRWVRRSKCSFYKLLGKVERISLEASLFMS